MNHLGQALGQALQATMSSTSPRALSTDGEPIPVRWVEDLFARLGAILGARAADVFGSGDLQLVKAEWALALGGFSAEEVSRGIAATRTRRFPPNLPEFLHLCRPALDPETAWIEAERGMRAHAAGERFAWSHPAVYGAAVGVAYELRTTTFAHIRKRWERLLAEQFALREWAPIPDPTAKRIVQQPSLLSDEEKQLIGQKLRLVRAALTGYRTKAEQDAALNRAEAQALVDPQSEDAS